MSRAASMQVLNQAFANANDAFMSIMQNNLAKRELDFNKRKWKDYFGLRQSADNRAQQDWQTKRRNDVLMKWGSMTPQELDAYSGLMQYKTMNGLLSPEEEYEWEMIMPYTGILKQSAQVQAAKKKLEEDATIDKSNIDLFTKILKETGDINSAIEGTRTANALLRQSRNVPSGSASGAPAEAMSALDIATGKSAAKGGESADIDREILGKRQSILDKRYDDFMSKPSPLWSANAGAPIPQPERPPQYKPGTQAVVDGVNWLKSKVPDWMKGNPSRPSYFPY